VHQATAQHGRRTVDVVDIKLANSRPCVFGRSFLLSVQHSADVNHFSFIWTAGRNVRQHNADGGRASNPPRVRDDPSSHKHTTCVPILYSGSCVCVLVSPPLSEPVIDMTASDAVAISKAEQLVVTQLVSTRPQAIKLCSLSSAAAATAATGAVEDDTTCLTT